MATLRRGPNVAIPSGDLYPNGLRLVPANPNVQATVRPEGSFFQKSAGYETIRAGRNRFQDAYKGMGIHFTPHRFAEDVGQFDTLPLMVDAQTAVLHADIADLPGSGRLDDEGKLTAADSAANKGVKLAESSDAAPVGGSGLHRGSHTVKDMGDREPGRPLTARFHGLLVNPADAFQEEYSKNPLVAIGAAGVLVGLVYYVGREFERNYRSRSNSGSGTSGAAAPIAAAPVAVADVGGGAVKDAAAVANKAATAAGDAAAEAASAAGDVAEAAGEAIEQVTDAVGDAVTE